MCLIRPWGGSTDDPQLSRNESGRMTAKRQSANLLGRKRISHSFINLLIRVYSTLQNRMRTSIERTKVPTRPQKKSEFQPYRWQEQANTCSRQCTSSTIDTTPAPPPKGSLQPARIPLSAPPPPPPPPSCILPSRPHTQASRNQTGLDG